MGGVGGVWWNVQFLERAWPALSTVGSGSIFLGFLRFLTFLFEDSVDRPAQRPFHGEFLHIHLPRGFSFILVVVARLVGDMVPSEVGTQYTFRLCAAHPFITRATITRLVADARFLSHEGHIME